MARWDNIPPRVQAEANLVHRYKVILSSLRRRQRCAAVATAALKEFAHLDESLNVVSLKSARFIVCGTHVLKE
jgi:hypothetical protein